MDGDALFPHVIGLCGAACFEFVSSSQLASFQQGQVVLLCGEVEGRGKREELQAQVLRVLVRNQTPLCPDAAGKQWIVVLMVEIFLQCYSGCDKFILGFPSIFI